MSLTIGQTIKKLRKERNLTQEELAELLNVTSQAVSKWENETGLPDISQIVPLSSALDVSIDVLFGKYGTTDDEKVQEITDKIDEDYKLEDFWDEKEELSFRSKRYELLSEALKQYPNNMKLLCYCIGEVSILAKQYRKFGDNRADEVFNEFVRIAHLIINYSKNMNNIMNAHKWLVWTYSDFGNFEKAIEHANLFPDGFDMSRGAMLAWINREAKDTGKEIQQRCNNINSLVYTLYFQIMPLGNAYYKNTQYKDAIMICTSAFDIAKALYGDKEYAPSLIAMVWLPWLHGIIAGCYLKLDDIENAFEWLEKLIEHHINIGKYCNNQIEFDTPLLRGRELKFEEKKYDAKNHILNELSISKLDSIRDSERFKGLIAKVNCLED